jgi:hypothetical protein
VIVVTVTVCGSVDEMEAGVWSSEARHASLLALSEQKSAGHNAAVSPNLNDRKNGNNTSNALSKRQVKEVERLDAPSPLTQIPMYPRQLIQIPNFDEVHEKSAGKLRDF